MVHFSDTMTVLIAINYINYSIKEEEIHHL